MSSAFHSGTFVQSNGTSVGVGVGTVVGVGVGVGTLVGPGVPPVPDKAMVVTDRPGIVMLEPGVKLPTF